MQLVFIVCKVENYRNILKLNRRRHAFTSYKAFLKNKKRFVTSLLASFSARFLKKNIFLDIFYCLTNLHCLVAFILWEILQYVYCNCLLTKLWHHKFSKLTVIKPFFRWPKSQDKNLNILRTKKTFKMKKRTFFKGLSLKQIKRFFFIYLFIFGRLEAGFRVYIFIRQKARTPWL